MKPVRFACISDLHLPHHDENAVTWALQRLREYKPDVVVVNGDLLEGDAASRWPNENDHDLADEYDAVGYVVKEIEAAVPGAEYVWTWGNHDANTQAKNRIPRKLRRVTDIHRHVPELLKWKTLPYINTPRCVYSIGQVRFFHGFSAAMNSDAMEGLAFGREFGLTVRGHTHRPTQQIQRVMRGRLGLRYWYANTGCLMQIDPPPTYVERSNTQSWGQAMLVGEAMPLKSPREGRYWDAHMEVYRMAWDDENYKYDRGAA